MGFSDSHHFRKTVAGWCMVVGPLLALAAFVFSPAIKTDSGAQLAVVAQHQDRFLFTGLASLVAVALVVVATLGLMHMLRERGVAFGHFGGALAMVGLLATMAQVGGSLTMWSMARDGIQAADVSTLHSLTHDSAMLIPLFIVPWLAVAGFAVLAWGLYAARAVDWWMAAMLAVGALGITLAGTLESVGVGIAGAALMLVGMGSVGTMVLRETDAEWEHTPEYRGFAAG
jgi:hypothetical protein